MSTLSRYLLRLFLGRFVLFLFLMTALGEMLDMFAQADEVLEDSGGGLPDLIRYGGLRLPLIVSELLPFTVLLALLFTLATLVRNGEIVIMKSVGISQLSLILALVPAALLIAVFQLLLFDRAVPWSVRALTEWGVGEYRISRDPARTAIWIRQGTDIVRIGAVDTANARLEGVTIFHRDEQGNFAGRTVAAEAGFDGAEWILRQVDEIRVPGGLRQRREEQTWQSDIRPERVRTFAAVPQALSLFDLYQLVVDKGFGNRPGYYYATALYHRMATAVTSVLMMILVIPLGQRFTRRDAVPLMVVAGVGTGFAYFILDGLAMSLGQAGLLPPVLATVAPLVTLASVGGTIAFHHEAR